MSELNRNEVDHVSVLAFTIDIAEIDGEAERHLISARRGRGVRRRSRKAASDFARQRAVCSSARTRHQLVRHSFVAHSLTVSDYGPVSYRLNAKRRRGIRACRDGLRPVGF
jgi:hypothetical protein